MNTNNIKEHLHAGKVLVSDGATGTNLLARGLPRESVAEAWLFEKPEQILQLHTDFLKAGADILLTNTFGASPLRLDAVHLDKNVKMVNQQAVSLARKASETVDRQVLIGGSMGPCGQLLKPYGAVDEDQVYQSYLEYAEALITAEVDFLVLETQFDIKEATLAVKAVREKSKDIPLVCSFSYDRGIHTMMGVTPTKMVKAFEGLGVDIMGINCGHSLEHNYKGLLELRSVTDLPIWFKPNAGLPQVDPQGNTYYDLAPVEMGLQAQEWVKAGATVVGGCCGTTPEHLSEIAKAVKGE